MGKHIGKIELDFLTDLKLIERDWNDDREENGGDVQRVNVAVVVAKEVFQRVRLLQNAEKRLQERAFHQKSVHSLVHSDVSEHMKHHLLEKQLQFFLVEPPQLRRHTRKDRHGLRENRHVGLLVIQQHHKRCQRRSRYNASQTGLASKQRTERSDDFAQRTQTEHDATLVLCGGRFVDGELKVRREEREETLMACESRSTLQRAMASQRAEGSEAEGRGGRSTGARWRRKGDGEEEPESDSEGR